MSRLSRFEECRFVGTRDTMRVYDQDDALQYAQLEERVDSDGLVSRLMMQSFAPDTTEEALNRGFRPVG